MTDPTPEPTPTRDEAVPFPAYGELPFAELGSAVKAAQFGAPEPYPFDPEFFPGHQVFGPINFNSLNRIVTWFVKRALASAPAPASGGVDAVIDQASRLMAAGWRGNPNMSGDDRDFMSPSMRRRHDDKVRQVVEFVLASLSPAATPVSEAEPVAHPLPVSEKLTAEEALQRIADQPLKKMAITPGWAREFAAAHLASIRAAALAKPASSPAGGDVREALRALYEWYDRDGSVGGASEVFEKHRATLSQSTSAGRVGE